MRRTLTAFLTILTLLLPTSAIPAREHCPPGHAKRGLCIPISAPATPPSPSPEPDPVPSPEPDPVPSPEPDPVPSPEPDLGPGDEGSVVHRIPESIVSDCSADVTGSVNQWLASVPNGEQGAPVVAEFARDACYRVDGTIGTHYTWGNPERAGLGRRHLVMEGNGSTIDGSFSDAVPYANRAGISLVNPRHVTVQNFTILGNHPNPCNLSEPGGRCRDGGYSAAHEWQHGVGIFGGDHIIVRNNRIHNAYGDGVTMSQGWGVDMTNNSVVEGNLIDGTGRMGVALTTNDNVVVRDNTFDRISYHVIDLEPEVKGVTNITIDNNTVKRHYLSFVAAGEGNCTPRLNYTVRDNVLEVAGRTAWPPLVFYAARYHSTTACQAEAAGLVLTGNTLPSQRNNLEAIRVVGFRDVIANDNQTSLNAPFDDRAFVVLNDVAGSLEVKRNHSPGVPNAYLRDGVPYGPGVDHCGNTTLHGSDPGAC
jgi:hypothetical protein